MTNNEQVGLFARMERVLTNPGYQNELAQVRSRATLRAVGNPVDPPRWTYVAPRFSRNSAAALYALEEASLNNVISPVDQQRYSRQLALAWESLAKLAEGTSRPIALLNAALAYELAGFQANSSFLAREILPDPSSFDSRPDAESLVASFLQRKLISTNLLADFLIQNPPDSGLSLEDLSIALGEVVLGDGLSNACRFFLSGDQNAYTKAIKLIDEAASLFDKLVTPFHSHIAFGIRAVLPQMKRQSTWNQLGQLVNASDIWNRYLTLLARGSAGPSSRGVTELWPSQIRVLKSKLLGSDQSTVVRLPTSSGKTRIAEMAIIDTLERNPGAKCVFVAPYRALAFEVERSVGTMMNDLGYRVSSVIGSYETDEFEGFLLHSADLLIVTPEKMDLVLRLHPELFDHVKLMVLDEIHIVDDVSRGIKFELLLSRLKSRFPSCRFLVMSAVIPDSSLQKFSAWLADSPDRSISSDWRPTIQRIARFEWLGKRGVIRFEHDQEIPELNTFVPGVIVQRLYSHRNPDTGRMRNPVFPTTEKGDVAAELAYAFSEQGPVLVFCTQTNWVESVCKKILNQSIGLRKAVGEAVHAHFDIVEPTKSLDLAREWLGDDHIACQSLAHGVALHHGRLPHVVREAIEADCRAGRYKVIVATNTLAQGVNLPVRTVVVHSTWRSTGDEGRSRIPVRDYFNIAGRAGRAGQDTEGLVVHLTVNQQDRRDFNHFNKPENLEPVKGALFQLLRRIVTSRLSLETIEDGAAVLDPEILAIAVEEEIEVADSQKWQRSLKGTLSAIQADYEEIHTDPLLQSVQLAAQGVFENAPELSWRKIYAQTGLKSSSCRSLREFVETYKQDLHDVLLRGGRDSVSLLNTFVINASFHLPEAQSPTSLTGDPKALLDLWIEGRTIDDIARILGTTDPVEQLSQYVEDLCGYRLPWIVSGLIRIARETLSIQTQNLDEYIRSYPSMIKYGLPDPVATWAMSAGIDTRKTALRIAEKYHRSILDPPSHESFVDWMASFSDESLHNEFEVTGYTLENLSYKIGKMATNPLLRPIKPLQQVLPIQTQVVGVEFENRKFCAYRVQQGDKLTLERDYQNPVDPNSVAVHHNAGQIGFLTKKLAQRLAPDIDAGCAISAKAVDIKKENVPVVVAELNLD